MSKILLGMSGGVDSTASALILKDAGYEVVGVYMKLHDNEAYHQENFEKAKRVANYLGIEIKLLDISEDFRRDVFEYFVKSYKDGITPNPCIICNRKIKFGRLIDYANSLGIDFIAMGHYARSDDRFIYKALDESKDQSYFLSQIDKNVVGRLIFPLGDRLKSQITELVKDITPLQDIAKQKESSEICFVENDYTDVLKDFMDIDVTGEVLDSSMRVVGTHKGYMHYTIGKRRGFRVDGAHEPHYVLGLNAKNNQIIVGKKDELQVDELELRGVNLFEELNEFEAEVKIRYRTKGVKGSVKIEGNKAKIKLYEPVFGVAKGQFGVFYHGKKLLGGGEII